MSRPRIVFMGTPQFAVPSLLACLEVGDVVAVITQADKPKGRGQQLAFSPVKEAALARGLQVLQPTKLKGMNFGEELKKLGADVGVVTAYGKILPKDVLDAPVHGCVNVHASLLPRFRGAAPIQWAIAYGDDRTGVCLMKMDEGLDTGPVIARRELPIEPTDTSASLHDKLSGLGGELIRDDLPRFLSGALQPVAQPSEGVVYAPMIEKEAGQLDFERPAVELERRMRAFHPWPGAFTFLEGKLLKVHRAQVKDGKGTPGEVLAAGPQGLEVACGQGSLLLLEIQPEGKRSMGAGEFLAGRKLAVGSRPFGGPPAKPEQP
jgi:methionyl-tRNA formyltransferase